MRHHTFVTTTPTRSSVYRPFLLSCVSALCVTPALAQQDAPSEQLAAAPLTQQEVISVTASGFAGAVDTPIAVELELTEAEVAEFGASSIADLLDALGPTVSTGRGRSGGRPIILLNGQRISSFREIRDLPPEAIKRVQIFPEELALQYGFRPDQRVVNFILKEDFSSIGAEIGHRVSTQGGYRLTEVDGTYTKITQKGRLNIDLEYAFNTDITEEERDIVQQQTADVGLQSDAAFRTLLGEADAIEANANWSYVLSPGSTLTVSGEYARTDTLSQLGLVDADVFIPGTSPFTQTGEDETVYRFLEAIGPLKRDVTTDTAEAGMTFNTQLGSWQVNAVANYDYSQTDTLIDQDPDTSSLLASIAAGSASLDPFASTLGEELIALQTSAQTTQHGVDGAISMRGIAAALPAGNITLSATAGFDWQSINSQEAAASTSAAEINLDRTIGFARGTMDVPLTSRDDDVLPWLGDFSINGNIGYSHLSDFGGLYEYGYGLQWQPLEPITITASIIGEEAAPSLSDLGSPLITTPNVSVFDFTTGQSVLVDFISGGNPDLLKEARRDLKVAVNYRPWAEKQHRFLVEYIKNYSENVTNAFPLLTTDIEGAFEDRVERSADGALLSVDARPVTFSQVRSERLRFGFELRGRFYASQPSARGAGTGAGPGAGTGGRPSGGGPGGGRGRPRGGWQLSAYHTYALEESVIIAPGIAEFDLLGGSTISSSTPLVRHSTELAARVFKDGKGIRISANYVGKGRINGNDTTGSSDLIFNPLFTTTVRAFYNLDTNEDLLAKLPFLERSRVSLRLQNVFEGIRNVTDENGDVPIAYQPGYLNATGRVIGLQFRKLF